MVGLPGIYSLYKALPTLVLKLGNNFSIRTTIYILQVNIHKQTKDQELRMSNIKSVIESINNHERFRDCKKEEKENLI